MKRTTIILALCLMTFATLSAQPNRRPRGESLRGGFLSEIPGITEEQKEKIQDIRTTQWKEMQKTSEQNRQSIEGLLAQQSEAQQKQRQEVREKFEKELKNILTADQFAAYQQKQAERSQAEPRLPRVIVIYEKEVPEPSLHHLMGSGQGRGNRGFAMYRPGEGPGKPGFDGRRPGFRPMGPDTEKNGEQAMDKPESDTKMDRGPHPGMERRGERRRIDPRGPQPEQPKESSSSSEANS